MIRHYLLSTIRNLARNRVYSIINAGGFAIGLASCILIFLWVRDELSYDRHFNASENIYRIIYHDNSWTQPRTPHPMPLAMVRDFPEVIAGVSISPLWGVGLTRPEHTVEYEDHRFDEKEILSADSTFFQVFPMNFIEGDAQSALTSPYGVVITESTAHKYFGQQPALGKPLTFDGHAKLSVSGVVQDMPRNTHFTFDFLISYVTLKAQDRLDHGGNLSDYYTWNDFGHFNYIRLKPGADPKKIEAGLFDWVKGYIRLTPEQMEDVKKNNAMLQLQPVTSIHLHSNLVWELGNNGSMAYVIAFSVTALLILIVAIFNFMNLATARSEKRAREVGVRKTSGARRHQLIFQFLLESLLLTLLSVFIAAILVELILPAFNSFTGKSLDLDSFGLAGSVLLMVLITFVVGILSGSYPSFFLSSFKPVEVLKGKIRHSSSNLKFRKVLVVFQFGISVFLVISTLIIIRQVKYLQSRDLGFNKSQVLVVPLRSDAIKNQFTSFREELQKIPGVELISEISNLPGGQFNNNSIQWKQDEEGVNSAEMWVDDDFFTLMQIGMKEGRAFSRDFAGDSVASFILNETACNRLNLKDPVGQMITWYGDSPGTLRGSVIGVCKDFHFQSLHKEIGPIIIQRLNQNWQAAYMLIRLKPGLLNESIRSIEKTWKQFEPAIGFKYSFLDQDFDALYLAEKRMLSIFRIFAALAILIACLGLLGLSAYTAELRTKEIGVRKVLGANTGQILFLLSKETSLMVFVASILAWPAAYFLMQSWLREYSYHTRIGWTAFVFSTLIGWTVAILTTLWQSWRAARQNPVEALKYE